MLEVLESATRQASRAVAAAGLLGLLLFAALSVADGLLRSVANRPLDFVRDLGGFWLAICIACCMPAGLIERAHVEVRFLGAAFGSRASLALDAFAAVLVAALMIALTHEFWVYSGKMVASSLSTVMLNVPLYPFWYVVTGVLFMATLVQLLVAVILLARCVGDGAPS